MSELFRVLIIGDGSLLEDNFPIKTKGWMFDIVNNKRYSIDIDKFDYLKRDTKHLSF